MSQSERKHRTTATPVVLPARACTLAGLAINKPKSKRHKTFRKAPLRPWWPSRVHHNFHPRSLLLCPLLDLDKPALPPQMVALLLTTLHIPLFRPPLLFLPDVGHVLFVLGPLSLAKLSNVPQPCSRFFPFVSLRWAIRRLFSDGLKFLPRGLPGFHVLFENLPDLFLLGPFLFQDNFSFVANLLQFLETIGQVNSGLPVYFVSTLPSPQLVSTSVPLFSGFSLQLVCRAGFPCFDV